MRYKRAVFIPTSTPPTSYPLPRAVSIRCSHNDPRKWWKRWNLPLHAAGGVFRPMAAADSRGRGGKIRPLRASTSEMLHLHLLGLFICPCTKKHKHALVIMFLSDGSAGTCVLASKGYRYHVCALLAIPPSTIRRRRCTRLRQKVHRNWDSRGARWPMLILVHARFQQRLLNYYLTRPE
jgi:hypothetical protein